MRIALVLVGFVGLVGASAATVAAAERTERSPGRLAGSAGGPEQRSEGRSERNVRTKGLSLEQIRGVMRAHARAFNACLHTATRSGRELHGPFLYQIEVDKEGRVTAARPYQPSAIATFDKCVTGVLKRARFPGGPASVEAPLVFDPS